MFTEDKPPLDELVHYGVKGMKRGVRKKETPQQKRSRELHERVQREQGRDRKPAKSTSPGVAKKMQKLQNLKSMKLSQLNKRDYQDMTPEQKRVARLKREDESLKKLTPKQKEARWRQLKKEGKLGDKYAKELVSW